jgi:dephospho-CoA kinase
MISFVCGQLCSGKTLYSETLSNIDKAIYFEVGDIVRRYKNTINRTELQDSKDLTNVIIGYIQNNKKAFTNTVISGVRQKEILEAFPEATLLWIECPRETRKQRYLSRQREGDNQTFEEAEQGDINLGILEVKQFILNRQ